MNQPGTKGTAYVYNEVTGQHTQMAKSLTMTQGNGFDHWNVNGDKIYAPHNRLVLDLKLPSSVINELASTTFGVSKQQQY
jgi:hypothetical protein